MTGEQFLNRISQLDYDLRALESEIARNREDLYRLQTVDISKDRVDGGTPLDIADRIGSLVEKEAVLNLKWDNYLNLREEARGYLKELGNAKYRVVLMEYYLDSRPGEVIAGHIGTSPRNLWRVKRNALQAFERHMRARHPGVL